MDDALRDHVAADDAAEDVHQDRAHVLVRENQIESFGDTLARCAAADVEEVGGRAAVQLDQVHRRHGEAGAVDHAGDVAVERDVVELVLGRSALHFVFLAVVAPLRQLFLTEQRVVLDVDLRVERDEVAVARDDQRVDLDQARILFQVQAVQRLRDARELLDLLACEPEAERQHAALRRLQPCGRVHVHADDLLRRVRGDFLDVHAARGGGDERHLALIPIQHQAQVQLARDLRAFLDEHLVDRQAFRPRLVRLEARAEHGRRGLARCFRGIDELHAAALAAAARVHLSFDDPLRSADAPRRCGSLFGIRGNVAGGHRDAVICEQLLGLVLVQGS